MFHHPQPASRYTPKPTELQHYSAIWKTPWIEDYNQPEILFYTITHIYHIGLHFSLAFTLALSALICINAASTMVCPVSDVSIKNFQLIEPYSEDSF